MLNGLKIIDLPEGAKISEPGFYRMSMDRHHNQPCVGPSVTSGMLRRMEQHGPEYFWHFWQLNPNGEEMPDSDAKRMGRVIATAMELGVKGLLQHYKVLPSNAPGRPTKTQVKAFMEKGHWSENAQARIDWWSNFDAKPGEIVSQEELDHLTLMMQALVRKPAARAALGGIPELDMVWFDEKSGLWCLSRIDNTGEGGLTDYKSCSPGAYAFDYRFCDRKIDQFGYHQQMAFGAAGWEALTGEEPSSCSVLFQRTDPPYSVCLREILPEELEIGRFQNRRALQRIRECMDLMKVYEARGLDPDLAWPGPDEDTGAGYRMHPGMRERLITEMNTQSLE